MLKRVDPTYGLDSNSALLDATDRLAILPGDVFPVEQATCRKSRQRSEDRPRRLRYQVYICSEAWLRSPARLAELELARGRCRICDAGPPERIEVHHRTYERLGCERIDDLTTLCSPCHRMVTALLRGRRLAATTFPPPADLPPVLHARSLTVSLRISGVAPLLMHNGRLADPLDEQTIALDRYTRKRVKTAADYAAVARVEWAAGMWTSGGRPCIPSFVVEACLVQAAKKRRAGGSARAGLIVERHSPLVYDGPSDLDELWLDARFSLRVPVQVQGRRVMRTRARFPEWTIDVVVSYLPHIIDLQQLLDDLVMAGDQIGMGDWRPRFGRFRSEVSP